MGKKLCEVNLLQFTFSRKLIFPDEYVALIDHFLKIFFPQLRLWHLVKILQRLFSG